MSVKQTSIHAHPLERYILVIFEVEIILPLEKTRVCKPRLTLIVAAVDRCSHYGARRQTGEQTKKKGKKKQRIHRLFVCRRAFSQKVSPWTLDYYVLQKSRVCTVSPRGGKVPKDQRRRNDAATTFLPRARALMLDAPYSSPLITLEERRMLYGANRRECSVRRIAGKQRQAGKRTRRGAAFAARVQPARASLVVEFTASLDREMTEARRNKMPSPGSACRLSGSSCSSSLRASERNAFDFFRTTTTTSTNNVLAVGESATTASWYGRRDRFLGLSFSSRPDDSISPRLRVANEENDGVPR